ncbi:hypothetical protein [Aeromicrobium sp. CF3.5]|uniref:hypothetical protein n=1 Tax=Aeromicrobium sp. CF3.5 TaxID=3373078 RepID=UPI003EE5D2C6
MSEGRTALGVVHTALDMFFDNPIVDLLGHLTPVVHDLQRRIAEWNPHIEIQTVLTTGADITIGTAEVVGAAMAGGFDWAVNRILDGIEAVAGFIGGAIDAALDLVDRVQRAFEQAVGEAIRMAQSVVKRLYDFGVRTAASLGHLVVEITHSAWEASVAMVRATTDFLVEIGMEALAALNAMQQASEALAALLVLAGGTLNPLTPISQRGRRRIDPAFDEDAARRFATDESFGRYAKAMNQLSGASYDQSGAPEGWERVENLVGPEGAAAALFVNTDGDYVLSFRGTQPSETDDIFQDLQNAGNLPSEQHQWSIRVAQEAGERAAGAGGDLDITGHSLGGSLASTASIATGQTATTFNAAGVGAGNHLLAMLAGGKGRSEEQITNFHTPNDPLTFVQSVATVDVAAGAFITVPTNTPGRSTGTAGSPSTGTRRGCVTDGRRRPPVRLGAARAVDADPVRRRCVGRRLRRPAPGRGPSG